MFFLIISLLSAYFINDADAACTGASPTWTCAADTPSVDIQTAINNAMAGDTINVGAGSGTWSNIKISKGINLIGVGVGRTVITAGTCTGCYGGMCFITYNPSDYTLNTPFRLSGFSFNMNGTCGGLALGHDGKKAPFTVQTKVRVDNNRFYNAGRSYASKTIWNFGGMYGVVDHNIFEDGWYTIKNDPQIVEDYNWWELEPQKTYTPGRSTNLYYENNTINVSGSDDAVVAECQYGGRYAFRYNTINLSIPSYSLFEMHGHQGSGGDAMPSCFGAEVYGNRVNAGSNEITLFKTRGGHSYIFNNSVVAGSMNVIAYDGLLSCPPSDEDPSGQMVHDTYVWGSRSGYTGPLVGASASHDTAVTCGGLTNRPTLGRDIISDGSSPGVTAGTLANRPATCTTGQGYWATDQSTTGLTGMVGVDPATPIDGTLYKCTATNTWTSYYKPYTFPHPLTKKPQPPVILKII